MRAYKNRSINYKAPVEIYRCLNRKGVVYSVRQYGKVVAHTESIVLKDCEFIVNKSGRDYVIKNRQKVVHAYIKGLIGSSEDILMSFSYILKYNPYKSGSFLIHSVHGDMEINCSPIVYTQNGLLYTQL